MYFYLLFCILYSLRQEVKLQMAKLIGQNASDQIDCEIGQHSGICFFSNSHPNF